MTRPGKLRLATAFLITFFFPIMIVNVLHADTDEDTILSALALNYCRNSLVKIQSYNDRIVLDEEYNNIINNIDLSKIKDEEIIELLEELLDTLSFYKLKEGDETILRTKYEKKVSNTFYSSFSGMTNIIYVGGGNPYAMAAAAVTKIGGTYANYRKNLVEYREELDDELWKLEKEAIEEINDIQKRFLRNSWLLMQKRQIPDIWRLTDSQLEEYVEILKDQKIDRRLRKLNRKAKYFQAYPPYWYYMAITALEANKKDSATDALIKFENIHRGFFREDNIYTSALMNNILLLDSKKHEKKIISYLNRMVDESTRDWRKNLFAALKYMELGYYKESKALLQINIDNEHQVSLHMRLIGEIYVAENNFKQADDLINKMVADDRVRSQDVLYLVGIMPEVKKLNKMKDQILSINIEIDESIYGKDDVEVFVPIKWIVDDLKTFQVVLNATEKKFMPSSFKGDEDKNGVVYSFKNVLKVDDEFEKKENIVMDLLLIHPSGEMIINGAIVKKCIEKDKNILDQSLSKAKLLSKKIIGSEKEKKYDDKKIICSNVYVKRNITTKENTYKILDDGNIIKTKHKE